MKRYPLIALIILCMAFALRVMTLTYAIGEPCLLPPEENWITAVSQPTSLYAWDTSALRVYSGELPAPADHLLLRLAGILAGMVVVAITLHLMRVMRSSAGWVIVLVVAVSPWIVASDRWLIASDGALLAVAVCVSSLWHLYHRGLHRWLVWISIISAMSLLLIAPSLWWVLLLLLACVPNRPWRVMLAVALLMVVLFPSVRSPLSWWTAAQHWDAGATSALVWLLLFGMAYFWRHVPRPIIVALGILAALAGSISVLDSVRLPRPSQADWHVITYLQSILPDGALTAVDPAFYAYNGVIQCPAQRRIAFVPVPYTPEQTMPDTPFMVLQNAEMPDGYSQPLDERYTLVRTATLPNPRVLPVRDQIIVLGSDLLTTELATEDILDIRLDFQTTDALNEQFSVYGLFVHVTQVGQPDQKVMEYGFPIGQKLGTISKRELFYNYHVRVRLPDSVPSGTYDVIVGFMHNVEVTTLERFTVGQVRIRAD